MDGATNWRRQPWKVSGGAVCSSLRHHTKSDVRYNCNQCPLNIERNVLLRALVEPMVFGLLAAESRRAASLQLDVATWAPSRACEAWQVALEHQVHSKNPLPWLSDALVRDHWLAVVAGSQLVRAMSQVFALTCHQRWIKWNWVAVNCNPRSNICEKKICNQLLLTDKVPV